MRRQRAGFEFEADYQPSRYLSLRAQGGYNDSHYISFCNAPCFSGQTAAEGCGPNTTGLGGPTNVEDISGRRRPFAPEWTFSAGFTADFPVGGDFLIRVTGDLNYLSDYLTQVPNTPGSIQDDITKIDTSIRFGPESEQWSLAVIGRNLDNKWQVGASTDKPGGIRGDIYGQVIRTREVALEATVKF